MNNLSLLSHAGEHYSNYDYSYTTAGSATALSAGAIALILFIGFIVFVALYALHAFFLGRIFKKAGLQQWIAWVPFYSTWKLLEIGGQQGFWAVLAIIPFVGYVSAVFIYIAMYHIGLKLGKSGGWVVLGIFFPTIWMGILALDSSKWHGKTKTVSAK